MMSIYDWRDGVNAFVAGTKPERVAHLSSHPDVRREWLDGYKAAQGWAMDHAKAEEWAHAPQALNQGLAAAAQNQDTGQQPTDQWPGRTHYGERLTALENDINTIFGCLDAQSGRMNQHEGRLDMIDGQMAGIAADLRVIILRLDDHDRRCDVHADDLKRVHALVCPDCQGDQTHSLGFILMDREAVAAFVGLVTEVTATIWGKPQ